MSIFLTMTRIFLDFRLFGQSTLKGELGIFSIKKVLLLSFSVLSKVPF